MEQNPSRQPLIIALIAGIPIATLGGWLWFAVAYTKDIEQNILSINELKTQQSKTIEIDQAQAILLAQLKIMFETTQSDIRDIKDSLRQRRQP